MSDARKRVFHFQSIYTTPGRLAHDPPSKRPFGCKLVHNASKKRISDFISHLECSINMPRETFPDRNRQQQFLARTCIAFRDLTFLFHPALHLIFYICALHLYVILPFLLFQDSSGNICFRKVSSLPLLTFVFSPRTNLCWKTLLLGLEQSFVTIFSILSCFSWTLPTNKVR